ncbi:class I SAM-dependent methyltransferase [Halobacillus litoralis]|uniref:class I SAM-dependent methyltransferase n=1 Tax=Halobacillus litoralis TaxID=45668 RepID=UPI001CFEE515|nr:class I SAM-dependent methyltransferase [Halobacillus litoralis]
MSDEIKKVVQDVFSKSKESYVQSSTHKSQNDLDLILNWVEPRPDWKVLDIATGGGHVAKTLSPHVHRVFATDLTKEMLQNTSSHLEKYANIEYVIADAENLPFLDESFDAVTCRIAPHHFPSPLQFIQESYRVLKPGGKWLMIDNVAPEDPELDRFYNTFEKQRDPGHVRALKKSEWNEMLRSQGFTIQKQLSRKKTLPFQDWVTRTLFTVPEQKAVEERFKQASQEMKEYFSIKEENHQVHSFTIDELMVLVEKHSS